VTMRFVLWWRAVVILLVLELLLGIWVNRYGALPATNNVVRAAMYTGDPALSAHMALAVVLVIAAFVLTIGAFAVGAPARLRWFALGGLLSLLWAYESGIEFIVSGFGNNVDSLSMALAFVVALVFYAVAQRFLPRGPPTERPSPPAAESA
jgi:hypothetical protein